tara:strand:+ start:5099 stop:5578 length:480 start_codon:yes stop_codon:yes gene_type:complete
MAIKYPDYLQNNNPNSVLIDATENQTKGFGFFDTTGDRDSLASALQVDGYLAIVGTTTLTAYVFQGGTWTDANDWSEIGGGLENIVEDLTPELGGALNVNGQSIVSKANGDITFTPNGTGRITLDGLVEFKRFDPADTPTAFAGGMYADTHDNLYFGVS